MHLESLKYFREVASEKSISKVAKKSHISQSALSQLIHKLEGDIGYKLLNRSNKGVELTEMGEIVLKYSNNIIRNYETMVEELETTIKQYNKVRINGTWALVTYSLPCVIYKIKKKYPNHQYELIASTKEDTITDVQNDICDFGIVNGNISKEHDLFTYAIGKEKIVLIAPGKYNIPDKIKLENLTKYDMIMCNSNNRISYNLKIELKNIDKDLDDLNIIFNVATDGAVKLAVSNGYGLAFVPYESIKHELYEKTVKVIEIEEVSLDDEIYLISKKFNKLTKAQRESIEYFMEIGQKSFC
ncbi:LysR family transcriptional regulator [Vallitalea sp.]|jgi:DNA-binding transcriptional LysR family regulator|uniref:LysR family transcriptional regulator n=1 Tax=Vallitalea sp. TaxID=1882829 RepID=UPI0025F83E2D|nr:LysR family transcriptional regulator [Vallitalea sp.]MCT4688837.1 LysR family transcriptional regulator [Vallitalea sp.]